MRKSPRFTATHIAKSLEKPIARAKLVKECVCPNARQTEKKVQIDRKMTGKIEHQHPTSYIKHLAVSGLSNVSARIKSTCNLIGKCFEMPNVSYT